MYAVIAENDQSQWHDDTGAVYHFPQRYLKLLPTGTSVVYYKGRMKDPAYAPDRLSPEPHYFGVAKIGEVYADKNSSKGDRFALIEGYQRFATPVPIKHEGVYLEQIPESRAANYWRDGVRAIDAHTFARILGLAGLGEQANQPDRPQVPEKGDPELESYAEGSKVLRYVTTYERDPRYRKQALAIHGYVCAACGVDMGKRYGPYAEGLIHVHHVVPVSQYEAPRPIDPATELVPVCPNCHAVIHRKKSETLSVEQLRDLLRTQAG